MHIRVFSFQRRSLSWLRKEEATCRTRYCRSSAETCCQRCPAARWRHSRSGRTAVISWVPNVSQAEQENYEDVPSRQGTCNIQGISTTKGTICEISKICVICQICICFILPDVTDTESYWDLQQSYRAYNLVTELAICMVWVLFRPYNQGTYGRCKERTAASPLGSFEHQASSSSCFGDALRYAT